VRLDKSPSEPENDVYEFDVGIVLVSGDVTIRFYSFPDDVDIKAANEVKCWPRKHQFLYFNVLPMLVPVHLDRYVKLSAKAIKLLT
jgi:hypothetical protein